MSDAVADTRRVENKKFPVQFEFLNKEPQCGIYVPIGGFGNHIRWLLTLNATIQASVTDSSSGQSWAYSTINDKINFIFNKIYSNTRSWHNWLAVEWQYFETLNQAMPFGHDISYFLPELRSILCTVSPEVALRTYLKFNSSLNNKTINGFVNKTRSNNLIISYYAKKHNQLCLNADTLYTEVLDREFYTSMINHLGFEDNYESAAMIHTRWYQLHQKAEREFVDYVTNFYQPEPNNNIGKTLNTAIGL